MTEYERLLAASSRVASLEPGFDTEALGRAILGEAFVSTSSDPELVCAISSAFAVAAAACSLDPGQAGDRVLAKGCMRAASSGEIAGTELADELERSGEALYARMGLPVPQRPGFRGGPLSATRNPGAGEPEATAVASSPMAMPAVTLAPYDMPENKRGGVSHDER